jgi:hypothetical protein
MANINRKGQKIKIISWITLATQLATLYLLLCIASHVGRPHMSQASNSSECDQGSCSGSSRPGRAMNVKSAVLEYGFVRSAVLLARVRI